MFYEALKFKEGSISPYVGGHVGGGVSAVDIDGDGEEELVIFSFNLSGGFYIAKVFDYEKDGIPIFHKPMSPQYPQGRFTEKRIVPYGSEGHAVDWYGKGKFDIAVRIEDKILLYPNTSEDGKLTFDYPVELLSGINSMLKKEYKDESCCHFHLVDWTGDGTLDILLGTEVVSTTWPKVDPKEMPDADWETLWNTRFDEHGKWKGGIMHGFTYLLKNKGTQKNPQFSQPIKINLVDGTPIDVCGWANPSAVDLDEDGDMDIISGDWTCRLHYFENTGTRQEPKFVSRGFAISEDGKPLRLLRPIFHSTIVHWGGKKAILSSTYQAYIQYNEFLGFSDKGALILGKSRFINQINGFLSVGDFSTPSVVDWDGDGDLDIISGDEFGHICYFENVGTRESPEFEKMEFLQAEGKVIWHRQPSGGGLQSPMETECGYTGPLVVDWDGDGLLDIIVCDVLGNYSFYQNIGSKTKPELKKKQGLLLEGKPFRSVWRVRPTCWDINDDGLPEMITLDPKGHLAVYERKDRTNYLDLKLMMFLKDEKGNLIKLDKRITKEGIANHTYIDAGRIRLCAVDWDNDGRWDILYCASDFIYDKNTDSATVKWLKNIGTNREPVFKDAGFVKFDGWPILLGMHHCCPFAVDWNNNGKLDMIVGSAEDGRIYYFPGNRLSR
ncbi:VCBS repeat-containing protein [bacterium]|nr:VCBS repeat-containing protein [bacterium]